MEGSDKSGDAPAQIERRFSDSLSTAAKDDERLHRLQRRVDESAVYRWQRASEQDPGDRQACHRLGLALQRMERYREAIAAYERALALYPIDAHALREMGICRYRLHEYREAATALRRATWYGPTNFRAWHWLGYSQYALLTYDEAAGTFGDCAPERTP